MKLGKIINGHKEITHTKKREKAHMNSITEGSYLQIFRVYTLK